MDNKYNSWFDEYLALAKYSINITAFIINIVIVSLHQKSVPTHYVLEIYVMEEALKC